MTHTTVIWRPFALTEGWQQLSWHSERARPWTQRSQQPKPRARQEALAHRAAGNQASSPLRRPDAIYFSFSSHCWHTVIAGPCCLATKSRQTFFQSSVWGVKLRPSPSLEEWLKGHFPPRLVWQHTDCLFWKLWRVSVCWRRGGPSVCVRTLTLYFFTLNN